MTLSVHFCMADEMLSPWPCTEDGTLHLSNVQQNDAGEYYCTAENRGGRDQRQTILSVAGKAKIHPDTVDGVHFLFNKKKMLTFFFCCNLFRTYVSG